MIRDLNQKQMMSATMNVVLKNGERFTGMDFTGRPFGEAERVVSFWHGDVVRVYPMSEVAYVELVPVA